MKKLRIALIGGFTPQPTRIRGGVQAAASYLINGLRKISEFELHILDIRSSEKEGLDYFDHNGVFIHLLPSYPRFERLRNYRNYQLIINQALEKIKPAVVHTQEAGSNSFVAIRSGYPTVVTAHGIRREDAKYVRSLRNRLRFHFDGLITERHVITHAKYLIAISHYITTYFDALFRQDINIRFIPNAIDESFFGVSGCSDKPVILFAGRVVPSKRVIDLIQAFVHVNRQFPQAELHIAGELTSDPSYVAIAKKCIRESALEKRIRLLGELGQDELLREYSACTLVALPSSQENVPMVVAQALAAGKPVVATRVGGIPEMIGSNGERGLLVSVGDISGLAEAIILLLQRPEQRANLGQAGHVFALENYHFEKVAQRTAEFYQEIAAREHRLHG